MRRRPVTRKGPLPGLLLSLVMVACSVPEPPVPRNLLLITLDTLRADHLGLYGYERSTSPELDAFAASATVFEDATCSMPTTLPSHASIFTGLRPTQHGLRRNGQVPSGDLVTLFDLLGEGGAATAAIIASRVLDEQYLAGMGFDEVIFPGSERQYQTRAQHVTDHAADWLERRVEEPGKSFALWLHYYDTHEPYEPPAALAKAFDRGYDGPLPDALDTPTLVAFNDPGTVLSTADLEHIEDLYDAEIAQLDLQLGRLFEHLDRLDVLDDTVVVLVGDHGQALGENAFFGHGLRLLEPVIKVPLIVRLPGQSEAIRHLGPVETIDLVPTLLELFGLETPSGLPGVSLVQALAGHEIEAPPFRFIERRAYPDQPDVVAVALHGGSWKAVYYRDEDGSETRHLGRRQGGLDGENLYRPDSTEARWLEDAWKGVAAAGTPAAAELDDPTQRMLRALGYID